MFSCRSVEKRQPMFFLQPHTLSLHSMKRVERTERRIHLQRHESRVYKLLFYSAALNTSEFLYLQHLFYVFTRPSIREYEPV